MFSDEAAAAKGGVVDRMGAVRGDTISNDMVDHIKAMMQDGDKRTEMVHSTDMDGKRMDGEHMDDGAQMAHMPVMDWAAKVRACNALGMPDMFHCVDTMWQ